MTTSSLVLLLTTFLPLLGALVILALPREEENLHRGTALATTLITFVVSLLLLDGAAPGDSRWIAVLDWTWVESLGIHFKLGIDGISLFLVLLTTFLMPVVILSAWKAVTRKVREFMVALLVLQTGMLGAFVALDLFLFYLFWEVMLVPMYLIIGIWGGDRRLMASIKFVLYTLVGSLLMLVAIIYLYVKHHEATGMWSFDYDAFRLLVLSPTEQLWCFLAFALAFCIKVPLFPLHTWLPDAHVEAPTAGSVILAGVLLKFGTYGLLRFAIPFFPWAVTEAAPYLAVLAVIGIIYGSLVAWSQTDVKKLVAYSSVAHLGFVVLGLMAMTVRGIDGAMLQNLAHGVSTPGLFLAIGVLYERRHTRRIDEFGGLWAQMPRYAGIFLVITLASVGLPGLSGFVAEFLVLLGTFDAYRTWTQSGMPVMFAHPKVLGALAATGVILGAVYMLWMFQRVMFGPNSNPKNKHLPDLSVREVIVFIPILIGAFWLGLRPTTFLDRIDPAVRQTLVEFRTKYATSQEGTPRMLAADVQAAAPAAPRPVRLAGAAGAARAEGTTP